jgi:hypothetical protein
VLLSEQKIGRYLELTKHIHLLSRLRIKGVKLAPTLLPFPPRVFMACSEANLPLPGINCQILSTFFSIFYQRGPIFRCRNHVLVALFREQLIDKLKVKVEFTLEWTQKAQRGVDV